MKKQLISFEINLLISKELHFKFFDSSEVLISEEL